MEDTRRCGWCKSDPVYLKYHDEEWGREVNDDAQIFEFIVLESAQAELTWITILKRRDGYRNAFADYDAKKVAAFTDEDVERLMQDTGIIRNRNKILATISNAKCFLDVQSEFGSFCKYLKSFLPDEKPIVNQWKTLSEIPASTPLSDIRCKDMLKIVLIAFVMLFCTSFAVIRAAEPEIIITYLPPLGESGNARGRVFMEGLNTENADHYAVIAMLHAVWQGGGGYYVKPYSNNYLNPVDAAGRFSILITTGGIDTDVDEVIFYLVEREKIGDADVVSPIAMNGKYVATRTIFRAQWVNPLPEVSASERPGVVPPATKITLSTQEESPIIFTLDGSDPVTSSTAQTYHNDQFTVPANGALLVKAAVKTPEAYSDVFSFLWLPDEQLHTPLWGLSVSLALNGESFGMQLSEAATRERMTPIAGLTRWARTFGTTGNGHEYINKIAKEMGLRTMIGLHITNDIANNDKQIEGLRKILQMGPEPPDLICVGNETGLSGVSVATLTACIDEVREMLLELGAAIPVGNADIANISWNMSLLDRIDFLGVNIYCGTWDNVSESQMIQALKQTYANTLSAYPSKHIIITETGTPYAGGAYDVSGGTQTPSIKKAADYLSDFCDWVQKDHIPSFYFEAFDEPVKSHHGGHPIEQYFGLMDGNMEIHSFYRDLVPVTGVSLNKTSATMIAGETEQLTATVFPVNALYRKVSWTSSAPGIAEVSQNGLVTAKSPGVATITATTSNGGYTATCELMVSPVTGMNDITNPSITIYLKDGCLFINSPASEIITIYSVSGTLMYSNSKQAGETIFAIGSIPDQLLMVRGSSGWVKKVIQYR